MLSNQVLPSENTFLVFWAGTSASSSPASIRLFTHCCVRIKNILSLFSECTVMIHRPCQRERHAGEHQVVPPGYRSLFKVNINRPENFAWRRLTRATKAACEKCQMLQHSESALHASTLDNNNYTNIKHEYKHMWRLLFTVLCYTAEVSIIFSKEGWITEWMKLNHLSMIQMWQYSNEYKSISKIEHYNLLVLLDNIKLK